MCHAHALSLMCPAQAALAIRQGGGRLLTITAALVRSAARPPWYGPCSSLHGRRAATSLRGCQSPSWFVRTTNRRRCVTGDLPMALFPSSPQFSPSVYPVYVNPPLHVHVGCAGIIGGAAMLASAAMNMACTPVGAPVARCVCVCVYGRGRLPSLMLRGAGHVCVGVGVWARSPLLRHLLDTRRKLL